jgi:hypothetical protein
MKKIDFIKKIEELLDIKVKFNCGTYEAYCGSFPSKSVIGHGAREVEAKYDLVCRILSATSTHLNTYLQIVNKNEDLQVCKCGRKEVSEIFYLLDDEYLCKACAIFALHKRVFHDQERKK